MRSRLPTTVAAIAFIATTGYCSLRPGPPPGTDDSTWINQEITAALQRNGHSYSLPAGTYYLENPIIVPTSAHDFTFSGAGSGQTFLKTPNVVMKQAIQLGNNPLLSDNWWITGPSNVPI